jgi:hypothetical protein
MVGILVYVLDYEKVSLLPANKKLCVVKVMDVNFVKPVEH